MQTAQAPLPFIRATRKNFLQLPDQPITDQLQVATVDCQRVGFLSYIDLYVFGTITPDTDVSGNWNSDYFPWNILRNVKLTLNTGIDIVNLRGYSLFLANSRRHIAVQPGVTSPADGGFNNSSTTGPIVARVVAPTGAMANAATPFGFHLKVPVAADDGLSAGLIQLQNQAYSATLTVQIGAFADWAASGASLGTAPTISATIRATQQHFSIPPDPRSWPDLTYVHQWLEQQVGWTASGQQIYMPPLGPVVCRVIADWEDDGVPADFFGTASDPTDPNFGQMIVQFAGSQRPEVLDFRTQIQAMYEQYAFDLPSGVLMWDFSIGGGSVEAGLNPRDLYNTGTLTDFELMTDTSTTPTNGKIHYIRELLLQRSA
jgi:hypothetical protein